MTLTPDQQKIRERFEASGIYVTWGPNGSISNVTPSDTLKIAMLTFMNHEAVVKEVATLFAAVYDDIIKLKEQVSDLEDEVYDLKGMVYHGESPGV